MSFVVEGRADHQKAQAQAPAAPTAVKKQDRPWNSRDPCRQPKEREQSDLCQQWRMAQATEELVTLADRQFWATAAEALLLAAAVVCAAWAAVAASRAAKATTESVRVMRNAERPYLTPSDPRLIESGVTDEREARFYRFWFGVENVGPGVGFIREYGIANEVCLAGQQGSKLLEIRSGFGRIPVSADAIYMAGAPYDVFAITEDERKDLFTDKKTLYLYGFIRYTDLFKVVRRSGFMFEYVASNDIPEEKRVVICPHPMWNDVEEGSDA